MKEHELKFHSNNDETLVAFTDEEKSSYKKAFNDIIMALRTLDDGVTKNTLQVGFKETLAAGIENYSLALCKTLGFDGVIAREKEERYAEIRGLNEQNRELRRQLGEKVSMEDLREFLKIIDDKIKRWWNVDGMGHVSELSFGSYGVEIKFSTMFTDAYYARNKEEKEEDYETCEQKGQRFAAEGWDIDLREGRRNAAVLATENNQQLFLKLLSEKYPSVDLRECKIVYWGKGNEGQIRELVAVIRDFDDV